MLVLSLCQKLKHRFQISVFDPSAISTSVARDVLVAQHVSLHKGSGSFTQPLFMTGADFR